MQFKTIKPSSAFTSSGRVTVEKINLLSVSDNLVDKVTFKFTLADKEGAIACDGIFTLEGDKYGTWDASDRGAYMIVCDALGLELAENNLFKAA